MKDSPQRYSERGEQDLGPPSLWWSVQGEWVEDVNQRRGGTSGIQRIVDAHSGALYYIKRQVNHLYRDLRFPGGRPTLLREWLNLHRCAELGVPTATPVFFDMRKGTGGWEAVLVTRGLDGYVSIEEGVSRQLWTREQWHEILIVLAQVLAPLHRARRKHGHLYPKEVFVRTRPAIAIALLDWEIGRYVGRRRWAAQSDLGRLWRSLMELGVSDEDRRLFLAHYQSLTCMHDLSLRGIPR